MSEEKPDKPSEEQLADEEEEFAEDEDEFAEDADEFAEEEDEFAEEGEDGGHKMPFMAHLDELRIRLVRSFYGLLVGFVICYIFKEQIYLFLTHPLQSSTAEGLELVYLDPTEAFFTYIKVAFLGSLVITSPWLFFQLWRFISPGLYAKERRLAWPFVLSSSALFIGGAIFCFTLVFPYAFQFLRSFETRPERTLPQAGDKPAIVEIVRKEVASQLKAQGGEAALQGLPADKQGQVARQIEDRVLDRIIRLVLKEKLEPGTLQIKAQFTMRNYLSFVSTLLLAFGVIFETPLVLVFLGRLGIVTSKGLRKKRKYAILGMFVVAAIFTPPDVVTQILMAVPLVGLFEISIWLMAASEKKRQEEQEELDKEAEA